MGSTADASRTAPAADKAALARVGEKVRARLAGDPSAYRIETTGAELYAIGEFLSAEECDHLMAMIDRVAQPSKLYGLENTASFRSSYSGNMDPADRFVRMIERRLCDVVGLDPAWGETVQGQRYRPGEEFQAHFDWFDTSQFYWPDEAKAGGQRSWTAMVYLNPVEQGGETEFPDLALAVAPQPGALLLWNNACPDGTPNRLTRHAGMPVVQGVKYIITKWFRTRPWG